MTETRTARVWYAEQYAAVSGNYVHETTPPLDIGDRQFLFVARYESVNGYPGGRAR